MRASGDRDAPKVMNSIAAEYTKYVTNIGRRPITYVRGMAARAPSNPPRLNRLEACDFHASLRTLAASPVMPFCVAYSAPSVPPSRGRNALHAHQVMSAVTAAARPLTVFFRIVGENSSRTCGGCELRTFFSQTSLSLMKSRASTAMTTGASPHRNT